MLGWALGRRPEVAWFSAAGAGRTANEDRAGLPLGLAPWRLWRYGHLYVVADGMGGHAAGEQASALVVQTLLDGYYRTTHGPAWDPGVALIAAVEQANREVFRQAQQPELAGMGSTVVAALVCGRTLYVAHVGDSRAYFVGRKRSVCLTADHTMVAELERRGALTPEEAAQHPARHQLSRSLGRAEEVAVDLGRYRLKRGDRVVLATDGLQEVVDTVELGSQVRRRRPATAARLLNRLAQERGHRDDLTVLVVDAFGRGRVTPIAAPAAAPERPEVVAEAPSGEATR